MSARATARRAARTLVRSLDRPGGRAVLGFGWTVGCALADRRWDRVRHQGDTWAYHLDGAVVFHDQLLRPARTLRADREIFLHGGALAPGDVVVDVGAGSGTEVVPFARAVGPAGHVVAVEAHPRSVALLRRALAANGLANVTVVAAAAADRPGTLAITDGSEPGDNTVMAGGTVEVPAVTIDQLVADLGLTAVALLKMNIEGAERLAVEGMAATAAVTDRLVISCHDFLGTPWGRTRAVVRDWLEDHGFAVTTRDDDPRPWCRDTLYARRPAG